MEMKISAIEAYGIACVEPNDYNRTRYTTIVRVRTDEGVSGWGRRHHHVAGSDARRRDPHREGVQRIS